MDKIDYEPSLTCSYLGCRTRAVLDKLLTNLVALVEVA